MPQESDSLVCPYCHQVEGVQEYDAKLWDLHWRRKDGRQNIEPLVYTQDDMEEAGAYDSEEDFQSVMLSMERDMHNRGICGECCRPNLIGLANDDFHSEADLKEMRDLWAEEAAERRAGC